MSQLRNKQNHNRHVACGCLPCVSKYTVSKILNKVLVNSLTSNIKYTHAITKKMMRGFKLHSKTLLQQPWLLCWLASIKSTRHNIFGILCKVCCQKQEAEQLNFHIEKAFHLPCNFSVTQAFYFSSKGTTCSRGNVQQMAQASVGYYSQNNLMPGGGMVLKQSW